MKVHHLIQFLENVYKKPFEPFDCEILEEDLASLPLNDLDIPEVAKNIRRDSIYKSLPSPKEVIKACKDYAEKKGESSYKISVNHSIPFEKFKCSQATFNSWFSMLKITGNNPFRITPRTTPDGRPNRFSVLRLLQEDALLNSLMNGLEVNNEAVIEMDFKNDLVADNPEYQSETWKVSKERWGWDARRINN